ncbi:Protein of unknown function [Phyllobacterium sp. OV277]|nr:Protein of unknown function [Phyllobacterium sp. OV277]
MIELANGQLGETTPGKVSASFMYGATRFNAFTAATNFGTAAEMKASRDTLIAYFVKQYQSMLEENIDDFIEQFDSVMYR